MAKMTLYAFLINVFILNTNCSKKETQYYWIYEYKDYSLTGRIYNITYDTISFLKEEENWVLSSGDYSKSEETINYFDTLNGSMNPRYIWDTCPTVYERLIALPSSNIDSGQNYFKLEIRNECSLQNLTTAAGDFKCRVYTSEAVKADYLDVTYSRRTDFYNPEIGLVKTIYDDLGRTTFTKELVEFRLPSYR